MITRTLTVVISSLLFSACFLFSNVNREEENIPEKIQKNADEFVISKTGIEFFNKYIKTDYEKVTKIDNGYLMVYNFSIPGKDKVEGEIRFSIDSLGNIKKDKEIVGIPECSPNPANCTFNVSEKEAVRIAENSELAEGIRDWEINFKWNPVHKKYVWEIISVLSETKGESFHRSTGQTMLIDPNNGDVIETSEWMIN